MLSGILRSERSVTINIQTMRAFTRMRDMLGTNPKLAAKQGNWPYFVKV